MLKNKLLDNKTPSIADALLNPTKKPITGILQTQPLDFTNNPKQTSLQGFKTPESSALENSKYQNLEQNQKAALENKKLFNAKPEDEQYNYTKAALGEDVAKQIHNIEDIDLDKGDAYLKEQITQARNQKPVTNIAKKQTAVVPEEKLSIGKTLLSFLDKAKNGVVDLNNKVTDFMHIENPEARKDLVSIGKALMTPQKATQVGDVLVANLGLGEKLGTYPAYDEQQRQADLQAEEMKQRSEDRKANIAYKNKILDDKEEEKRRARENFIYQNQVALQELGRARDLFNSGGKDYFGASVPEKAAKNSWKWLVGDSKGTHDVSKYDAIKNIFNSETIKNMRATIGAQFTADESKAYQELSSAANLTPDQFEEKFTVAYNGFARNLGMPLATREEIFPSYEAKEQNFRVVD